MKTILVTGGAGFIGSNLCKRLLEEDNKVICVDNLSSGRYKNIEEFILNKHFKFVDKDIKDLKLEDISFDFWAIDEIYNLACPASPPYYQSDPIFTMDTNYLGVKNMLELATILDIKILQTSTSEVYGDPEVHPQPETYWGHVNPDGIRACYDEGKRIAETLCYEFNRLYNTKVRVARIFNTYGPYMDPKDGRVVSNFIVQALKNKDLTVYGDGSQTRSFCYVDDMVEGLIKLMNSNYIYPVNLGNPCEFTVKELANKVLTMVDTNSKIVYKDLPSDDPTKRRPDIKLAKKELNWQPTIQLQEGLEKTIKYFEQEI